jgi:hypothetical protein
MGFLSGLSGVLGGGSQSTSSGRSVSGFSQLPPEIQTAFKDFGSAVSAQIPGLTQAYTPLAQTADETAGLNAIRQGFAPTAQSLSNDIGLFMNPYQQYVEDPVNRAAASDYSILKQGLNEAGQFGSNRQILGANDIENTRLSTIGGLRQNAYNSALDNVLTQLIPQRIQDASGLLGIGQFQRNLNTATKTAGVTGLQQLAGALGALPQSGGTTSTQGSNSSASDTGTAGNLISTIGTIASLFSDERLKENIEPVGEENGFPIYEFNYKGDDQKYIGVMAQDVEKIMPSAVRQENGYKSIDYDMIGVQFREA